jgi:DNA polymerase-3 subunit gamma/tau
VLSRCQRFDLRRIEPEVMIAHLRGIAGKEGATIEDEALSLITRAAEGSVRDAVSLLDQAISHGAGETSAEQVRAMLGLADRARVLDLFDMILGGDAAAALTELSAQYAGGGDPLAILRDLAEVTHWVSIIKITPEAADDPTVSPDERVRGSALAERLPMRVLARMWQMLLKALDEVSSAPNAMMAAEMAVIRLTHVADLPTPEDLVRKLRDTPPSPMPQGPGGGARASSAPVAPSAPQAPLDAGPAPTGPVMSSGAATAPARAPDIALARYARFDSVLELIRANRDVKLLVEVEQGVRLVSYAPGRIEFEPSDLAAPDLAQRLGSRLQMWTGARWGVSVVGAGGAPTIAEERAAETEALKAEALKHPLTQAVLAAFPEARITAIRTPEAAAQEAAEQALPEVDDEWDPFEES